MITDLLGQKIYYHTKGFFYGVKMRERQIGGPK